MRRSVSQETCLMKYVDASGQGLSTQMGQVISAGNPETLFVRSGPLMVCFFHYFGGYPLIPLFFFVFGIFMISSYGV